ncbi:MAG: amidophosphoribosyltransferase [Candidatus Gracilibacteria bacterium]|jgi:amidophosphoribosyltransferase|nr:amidophosphoribosyltransferase [Candidatus Gracilibacteria bacterium]
MCGVLGISANSHVNQDLFDGLTILQHRGQDASGIATFDGEKFYMRKGNGLVRDVFFSRHMQRLTGSMGIAHVRYPTAGCNSSWEAQPFFVNSPFGIALAHNGNLTNADLLSKWLFKENLRHLNTSSDSEVLLNVLANKILKIHKTELEAEDIFEAVKGTMQKAKGSYAVVAMIAGQGLVGFRDPYGIRPLCIGKREHPMGTEYCLSSESLVFEALGFEFLRDVKAGEAVFIKNGELHSKSCLDTKSFTPCIFEYVYLARPDSMIDDISVHKSRLRMGDMLARQIKEDLKNGTIEPVDIVVPVPESARTAASELAHVLSVPYREGFVKNRYIGRTFIMPGQQIRKKSIKYKLSAVELEFKGKNVMIVDDSIVRGNTSKQIVEMARDAGAKNVYFASAAPALHYPCVYGVDMPSKDDFVANGLNTEEIAKVIGADKLYYQKVEDLIEAVRKKTPVENFCTACFDGKYPTPEVDDELLADMEAARNKKLNKGGKDPEESPVTLL